MHIHTHGSKGDPVIIILHPMGITGEKMYEIVGSKFRGEYYFLTPDMGGHGSEKRKFRSAKAEAAALHNYLQQKGLTQIRLLYGASLGCAVSLHLLRYEDLDIEHVYLDGAPVARLGAVMRGIFAPVLVWQQDMIIRNREKGISDFVKRYGRDIAEHMADSFLKYDKESIYHIGRDCVVGNISNLSRELQKRICFDWGEKELYTKTSMPLVKKIWPDAEVIVRPGMEHCEAMAQVPDYVEKIEERITGSRPVMIKLQGLDEDQIREISRQIAAEKKALGGFQNMKEFIDACFSDGGTIETRMQKEKRKFLRIEMLVVRKEFQGQGYMHRMMDFAYALAEERRIPVILDTDDRDKASRYEHLGMKLDRVRSCGERFHMYDLIREDAVIGCL